MKIRVGFRMVTPRHWTGGLNYLTNICRVLRVYEPDVEPVFFAPPDLDPSMLRAIGEATGAAPYPLRERTHRDDAQAIVGWEEKESRLAFAAAGIDVLFEATGYYGPDPFLPVVSWMPDFQHRRLPHMFSPLAWLIREQRYRLISANRRVILLSSESARADMVRYYGQSRGSIIVAPFAVRMEKIPSFDDGERLRLARGLPERFIFLPNQFWPHKNHRIVAEALGLLGRDAPFIVATGGGDRRAKRLQSRLKEELNASGVGDRFQLLGHLGYADIPALMVRCDAVLNPSLFEGWSTSVEEAKAVGAPLLLSDLPVHREQVGENAIFFDPTDARSCAEALRGATALAPRKSPVVSANAEAQRAFAFRLKTAFLAAAPRSEIWRGVGHGDDLDSRSIALR